MSTDREDIDYLISSLEKKKGRRYHRVKCRDKNCKGRVK